MNRPLSRSSHLEDLSATTEPKQQPLAPTTSSHHLSFRAKPRNLKPPASKAVSPTQPTPLAKPVHLYYSRCMESTNLTADHREDSHALPPVAAFGRFWPLLAAHRDFEHQRQLQDGRFRSHAAAADIRFRVASNSTESVSLRYQKHSQTASQIPTLSYWMRHHETRARKNHKAPLIHPCESPPAMLRLYNRRVPTHPTGGPVPCSH